MILMMLGMSACTTPSLPQLTPTGNPAPVESPTPTSAIPQDVAAMIATFAQANNIDPATISYISSEQLDWPDGCMGITRVGYMCAMVVTPGYRIIIAVNGLTVELHTNLDGSVVLLAPLSSSNVQPLWMDWMDQQSPCIEAQLSDKEAFSGSCNQLLVSLGALTADEETQILDWNRTYASFVAQTPSGMLAFYGQGSELASGDVQTTIAQWIDNLIQGASTQSTPSREQLAVSWSRSGGIAGFCDQMTIQTSGAVEVLSCKSNVTPHPSTKLDAARFSQLNQWLNTYLPTEIIIKDSGTADSMTVTLNFDGKGTLVMPEDIKAQLASFALDVFNSLH